MTLGVTGVVWLPRTATGNSVRLLGPGPVPLHVAGGAWTTVALAYAEASASIAAVTAGLAATWEGAAATLAQAALGRFVFWTGTAAFKAACLAVEAPASGTKYGVALLTMPTLVEIGAIQTAKVAAASTGGALNGSYEAAEIADRLLDLRAAVVMEAFELVSSHLVVKTTFDHPPAIVAKSSGGLGSFTDGAVMTSPAQAAIGGLISAVQNPGTAAAAGQVGSAASSIASTGASTVTTAMSSIGTTAGAGQGASTSIGGQNFAAGGSASTRPTSFGAGGFGGGSGFGGQGGFGGAGFGSQGGFSTPGSTSGSAGGSALTGGGTGAANGIASGTAGTSDGALARGGAGAGGPASGSRAQSEDDDHETPDYLKQFEHFADGRTVAPSVIGGEPAYLEPTGTDPTHLEATHPEATPLEATHRNNS